MSPLSVARLSLPFLLDGFWASADVNGDCSVIGSDVTRMINYLRGVGTPEYYPDYEPAYPPIPPSAPSGWPNCDPIVTGRVVPTGSDK